MLKGYGTTPIGGIIMWSGSIDEIPDGWALCDGEKHNGKHTPDLRGRFIVGYSEKYENENDNNETYDTNYVESTLDTTFEYRSNVISRKTGEDTLIWDEADSCNLNSSDCRIDTITGGIRTNNAINDDYNEIGLIDGERKHKLTAEESALPDHKHSISHDHNITDPGHAHDIRIGRNGGNGEITKEDKKNKGYKTTETAKTGISVNKYYGNSENKKINKAASAHENRPPYYVLAYIMRVK
jgi:microcystin-dependent protein